MEVVVTTEKPELRLFQAIEADPFDPAAIRLTDADRAPAAESVLITVKVGKPSKTVFFRVRDDEDYIVDTALLEYERDFYLVDAPFRAALRAEIKPVLLHTCISRAGVIFLWPLRLVGDDGRENPWWTSARIIADAAKTKWVRAQANMALGAYELIQAVADLPEPVWPKHSFRDLLKIAFEKQRIDSMDHIVVQQLQGRV
jgi:hypothetical protein